MALSACYTLSTSGGRKPTEFASKSIASRTDITQQLSLELLLVGWLGLRPLRPTREPLRDPRERRLPIQQALVVFQPPASFEAKLFPEVLFEESLLRWVLLRWAGSSVASLC